MFGEAELAQLAYATAMRALRDAAEIVDQPSVSPEARVEAERLINSSLARLNELRTSASTPEPLRQHLERALKGLV